MTTRIAIALLLSVEVSACYDGRRNPLPVSTTTVTGAPSVLNEALDDAQIADLQRAFYLSVVQPARLASTRATLPRVQQFAAMLFSDYTASLNDEYALVASLRITPQPSDTSRQVDARNNIVLSDLDDRVSLEFDRVFMHGVSTTLQRALDGFDYMLLPSVRDARLRAQLLSLRPKLWADLNGAIELEGWLATQQ